MLDALAAVHRAGLVHRDVSAANVLVGDALDDEPPPVWLMDLGLAGRVEGLAAGGTLTGTPATMAPEALRGGAIDGRADLYSLGCVLYRVLTGQDPFLGQTVWEVLRARLAAPPAPPSQLAADVPASLEHFVLTLLAIDPARRFATAEEARPALAELSGPRLDRLPPLGRALEPSFAGRAREQAAFLEALERRSRGTGEVLLADSQGRGPRS